ncbi:MAG: glycosyltransferase [Planctomycetes bacterium]|nr:glycosyltransferase [Planctomycetota bacterium]
MSKSLVLLPTYNERASLPRVVPRLAALEAEVDVLVLDDASPDGTGMLAEELSTDFPRLSVLHRKCKEGLGRAYVHGFQEALRRGYGRVVTMDADLSHAPEDVPRLLEALEEADLAVGSRLIAGGGVEDWPLPRRLLSRAGSLYARSLLGLPVRDATSGFRAYRAEALQAIELDSIRSRGFAFQVEILRRVLDLDGARVSEVPVLFRNRRRGKSKLTLGIIHEAAVEVLRLRFRETPLPRREGFKAAEPRCEPPSVGVIIPLRPGAPEPRSLETLESIACRRHGIHGIEVILARGECPSRQRNAAAREASGDLFLFLDDDSEPSADLIDAYLEAFRREPDAAAIGGPAVYSATGFRERLSAAILSEPLVTGRSAARFSPRGSPRASDERELILCNLALRRSAFEAAGGFDEALYPNEENLLLDRLRDRGEKIRYEPSAAVTRPAPRAGAELLAKVFRYGRGRAAQARRRLSASTAARVSAALAVPLFLVAALAALPWTPLPLLALGALLLSYHIALAVRISTRRGPRVGLAAPLLATGIHLAYAAGILWGLLKRLPEPRGEVTLSRRAFGVLSSPAIKSSIPERRSSHVQGQDGRR